MDGMFCENIMLLINVDITLLRRLSYVFINKYIIQGDISKYLYIVQIHLFVSKEE